MINQSHSINTTYKIGDIIKYERWIPGDEVPEIFECQGYDEDWGVVHYNDNGRKDTIGIAYVRLANNEEIAKLKS